jgi:RimJ/RimL family protein N-acetyltransferase
MLRGQVITLRPVQEEDLPVFYEHLLDIDNRGDFYPRNVQTLSQLRKDHAEHGFWSSERGMLMVIDNASGKLIGSLGYFPTVPYMDELEIGYIIYDQSSRRRGAMTEALKLLTWFLFDTKNVNRIRLTIVTENTASRRVAEKGGYKHEGTMRGCFFNAGRHHNMELYAIVRADGVERPTAV